MTKPAVSDPTALTVYNPDTTALSEALLEVLSPGERLTATMLPLIKVPAAGGRHWELPDGSAMAELQGVIIHRQTPRAYWIEPFSGDGNPPDCSSPDGLQGKGSFDGQDCATCQMSQYGSSGKGNSQACRQITRLFVLFPGAALPTLLSLPPSSYRAAQTYAVQTVNSGGLSRVITGVSLEQDKSAEGITYSKAQFRVVAKLDEDQAAAVRAYRAAVIPYLTALAVTAEEEV